MGGLELLVYVPTSHHDFNIGVAITAESLSVTATVRLGEIAGGIDVALVDVKRAAPVDLHELLDLMLLAQTAGWFAVDRVSTAEAGEVVGPLATLAPEHVAHLPPQLLEWSSIDLDHERVFRIDLAMQGERDLPEIRVAPSGFSGTKRRVSFHNGRRTKSAKISHADDLSLQSSKIPEILCRWLIMARDDSAFAQRAANLANSLAVEVRSGRLTADGYPSSCASLART